MFVVWLLPLFLSYGKLQAVKVPVPCNMTANCLLDVGDGCYKKLRKADKHDLQVVMKGKKKVWCDKDQDCLCYRQIPDKPAVLLTGGGLAAEVTDLVELYPSRCPPYSPLPEGRYRHVSFETNDKTLASCGGFLKYSGDTDTCIVFDKSGTPQWGTNAAVMGNLMKKRVDATAVTVGNGVYILGGTTDGSDPLSTLNTSEFLENEGNTWESGPVIPGFGSRYSCSVAISPFSFLLIGGGFPNCAAPDGCNQVWEYHTPTGPGTSGQWFRWNNLKTGRGGHRCAKLKNRIIIAGGVDTSNNPIASTEIIDLGTGTVTPGNPLPNTLLDFGMATIGTKVKNIIAFGGSGNFSLSSITAAVNIWDDSTESWLPVSNGLDVANRLFGFVAIDKNQVC